MGASLIVVVLLLAWHGTSCIGAGVPCDEACQQQQRQALEDLYDALDGVNWRAQGGWLSSQPHCTWEGVTCCTSENANASRCPEPGTIMSLSLYLNNASGVLPVGALEQLAPSLQYLDLRDNRITGTLPSILGRATHLRWLLLDINDFSGTLPSAFSSLSNLTMLSLAGNRLTGTLPDGFTKLSQLKNLIMDRNCITGVFPGELIAQGQIEVLSMRDCCFTSISKPHGDAYEDMVYVTPYLVDHSERDMISAISFNNNSLSGTVPVFLMNLQVTALFLAENQLTGSIPDWRHSMVLAELDLSRNQFNGTLPPLFVTGIMRSLDLSGNNLQGSLPVPLGDTARLEVLNLSDNALTGTIPEHYNELATVELVGLSGNNLSRGNALPSWVVLAEREHSWDLLPGSSGRDLLVCKKLHTTYSQTHFVTLDPIYYSFESCACEEGLMEHKKYDGDELLSFTCLAPEEKRLDLRPVLIPTLVSAFLILLGLVAYKCRVNQVLAHLRMGAEKRVPPGAEREITLVLTDVQGSTELWEWDMETSAEALQLHDRLMRKLMGDFYGYEVSTEGDAFLVAFHEPFDAVAWCLAAQLALHYAEWPKGLLNHRMTCEETAETCLERRRARQVHWERMVEASLAVSGQPPTAGAAATYELGDSISTLEEWHAARRMVQGTGEAAAAGDELSGPLESGGYDGLLGDARDAAGLLKWRQQLLFRGMRVRMSVATGYVDSVHVNTVTKRSEYTGDVLKKVQAVGEAPHGGQVLVDPESFQGIHNRLLELGGVVLEAVEKMSQAYFACSTIPAHFTENPGPARGGRRGRQPSLTSSTDRNIDAQGRGPWSAGGASSLQSGSTDLEQCGGKGPAGGTPRGFSLGALFGGFHWGSREQAGARTSHSSFDGSSLDIEEGGSMAASGTSQRHKKRYRRRSSSQSSELMEAARSLFRPFVSEGVPKRNSSISYGVMVLDMGVHELAGLEEPLNITQVMPPGLEDRARFFPRLASVRQQTPGYFEAPAAGLQPLGGPRLVPLEPLPEVVIVFCTMESFHDMGERNKEAVELAVRLFGDTVRWLLLAAGGYKCQYADGSFMVAFTSADAAVEWCLMVQLVLRDLSWPASVLELPMCEEERDMHGNVVFRGPRVKMGIYSGVPTRVLPHSTSGRADYFGPLVNRAARYCHAAARGGQVLLAKELMLQIISSWLRRDISEQPPRASVQECCVYFADQGSRAWPWKFMRRHHLDPPPPEVISQPAAGPSRHGAATPAAAAAPNGVRFIDPPSSRVGTPAESRGSLAVLMGSAAAAVRGLAPARDMVGAAAAAGGGSGAAAGGDGAGGGGETSGGPAGRGPLRAPNLGEGGLAEKELNHALGRGFPGASFSDWTLARTPPAASSASITLGQPSHLHHQEMGGSMSSHLALRTCSFMSDPGHGQQQVVQLRHLNSGQGPSCSRLGLPAAPAAHSPVPPIAATAAAAGYQCHPLQQAAGGSYPRLAEAEEGLGISGLNSSKRTASVGSKVREDAGGGGSATPRSCAGPVGPFALLSELGQQVGMVGGLHTSNRRRRRSNPLAYEPDAGHPGAPVEFTSFVVRPGGSNHSLPIYVPYSAAAGAIGRDGFSQRRTSMSAPLARLSEGGGLVVPPQEQAHLMQLVPVEGEPSADGECSAGPCRSASDPQPAAAQSRLPAAPASAAAATAVGIAGPAVAPLPDQQTLQNLRLSGPVNPTGAANTYGTEASTAVFEGFDIGRTCSSLMSGRWLWARQLLVHDLGTFKFKGVAGTHAIVSVTIEELAGRTFPTTIRKGKGVQLEPGRGLQHIIYMLPASRCKQLLAPQEGGPTPRSAESNP